MTVYFTADHHFGQASAPGLFQRPFGTVGQMDEAMIERWNAVVGADDEVWHLGDFAIEQSEERVEELLATLEGTKHLLRGNNDRRPVRKAAGWASVSRYEELKLGETRLVLCHYPFRSWRKQTKGALNLHGHSHGKLRPLARQVDVGVDVWDFRPVTLEEILESLPARQRRRTR